MRKDRDQPSSALRTLWPEVKPQQATWITCYGSSVICDPPVASPTSKTHQTWPNGPEISGDELGQIWWMRGNGPESKRQPDGGRLF